ncbi:MAG: Amine oxidase [Candidatus Gottesmanbacteria bacterium GW2011_GWB1_44_11c]|uniref:Amine oxidase n=1 Tax=Candidatus Gottesmanbacteria bacterium GW2011_GWB1_44_11c TaxID=1618447 RepID=A0A0G1GSH3_9BACT|nr:MAG: Amine oxidase [Candidatus Gottesmanbacteria bacterium GW2011_GWB1_44_11c]
MNIAIIGGGLTGLTAAYELLKYGHQVTVFEKEKTLGGLAGGFKPASRRGADASSPRVEAGRGGMPNWTWSLELFYHHFFTNDSALISLAKELGLEKDMLILRPITSTLCQKTEDRKQKAEDGKDDFKQMSGVRLGIPVERPQSRNLLRQSLYNLGKVFMWSEDKENTFEERGARTSDGERRTTARLPTRQEPACIQYQLDSPMNLLTFPLLSPFDKLRTAALLAFCKINPFWQPLEKITAERFFKIIGGSRAWNILWQPLMEGKFGTYANGVPASWLWARFHKRTMRLGYFREGFQTFIDRLAEAIKKRGGTILTKYQISNIKYQKNFKFQISNFKFDHVLITTPSSTAIKLIQFPKLYEQKLKAIPHLLAQTLILETDKPILEKTYWLNIADSSFPFVAVVAHTNMVDKKYYGNRHITYIGNYLPDRHPYLSLTKHQLLKVFTPYIQILNSSFNSEFKILNSELFSAPNAQPVHTLNYSQKAPGIKTPIDGIYLANLDSIFPWDRGTNYAVELGKRAASLIAQNLASQGDALRS